MTARIVTLLWDEESRPSYMTPDYATRRRLGPSDLCASSERTHDLRPSMPTGWAPSESMFAGHGVAWTSIVLGSFDEGRDDACN